ncbi:MAG: hypothetical protein ACC662_11025 [Planctomycetota bacterium]
MRYYVEIAGRERVVEIQSDERGLRVLVDKEPHPVDLAEVPGAGLFSLLVDGNSHAYGARFENGEAVLSFHHHRRPDHAGDTVHGGGAAAAADRPRSRA